MVLILNQHGWLILHRRHFSHFFLPPFQHPGDTDGYRLREESKHANRTPITSKGFVTELIFDKFGFIGHCYFEGSQFYIFD